MVFLRQVVLFSIVAMLGVGKAMAVEEAEYTVLLTEENFEIRWYEPHILAETMVNSDFNSAGNMAFSRLFKYISGNNTSQQKVEMTSPVVQEAASEKIDMTYSMVPPDDILISTAYSNKQLSSSEVGDRRSAFDSVPEIDDFQSDSACNSGIAGKKIS